MHLHLVQLATVTQKGDLDFEKEGFSEGNIDPCLDIQKYKKG